MPRCPFTVCCSESDMLLKIFLSLTFALHAFLCLAVHGRAHASVTLSGALKLWPGTVNGTKLEHGHPLRSCSLPPGPSPCPNRSPHSAPFPFAASRVPTGVCHRGRPLTHREHQRAVVRVERPQLGAGRGRGGASGGRVRGPPSKRGRDACGLWGLVRGLSGHDVCVRCRAHCFQVLGLGFGLWGASSGHASTAVKWGRCKETVQADINEAPGPGPPFPWLARPLMTRCRKGAGNRVAETRPPPPPHRNTTTGASGGSVDTTKTRSDPQRVRMSSGERPIGAAEGKQPNTEALCQTSPQEHLGLVATRLETCSTLLSHPTFCSVQNVGSFL